MDVIKVEKIDWNKGWSGKYCPSATKGPNINTQIRTWEIYKIFRSFKIKASKMLLWNSATARHFHYSYHTIFRMTTIAPIFSYTNIMDFVGILFSVVFLFYSISRNNCNNILFIFKAIITLHSPFFRPILFLCRFFLPPPPRSSSAQLYFVLSFAHNIMRTTTTVQHKKKQRIKSAQLAEKQRKTKTIHEKDEEKEKKTQE